MSILMGQVGPSHPCSSILFPHCVPPHLPLPGLLPNLLQEEELLFFYYFFFLSSFLRLNIPI